MERINRVFKASRCHSLLSVLIDCGEKRIALTNRQLFHYVVELFSLDLKKFDKHDALFYPSLNDFLEKSQDLWTPAINYIKGKCGKKKGIFEKYATLL